jgi:hypothetical protein
VVLPTPPFWFATEITVFISASTSLHLCIHGFARTTVAVAADDEELLLPSPRSFRKGRVRAAL